MKTTYSILCFLFTLSIASGQKKTVCEGYMYINDDSMKMKKLIEIVYVNNKISYKIGPGNLSGIISDNLKYKLSVNYSILKNIDSLIIFYDTVSYSYYESGLINSIITNNIFAHSIKYHLYTQLGQIKSTIEHVNHVSFKNTQINTEIYDYDINNMLVYKRMYTNPYDTSIQLRIANKYTYKNNKIITDTMLTYDILNSTNSTIDAIFIDKYNYEMNRIIVNKYLLNNNVLSLVSRSDSSIVANNKNGYVYCQKEGFLVKYKELHYYSNDGLLQKSIYFNKSNYLPNHKLTVKYRYANY